MLTKKVLVIFDNKIPDDFYSAEVVISKKNLKEDIQKGGLEWMSLEDLSDPESIYEASSFVEDLSLLKKSNDLSVPKSFIYKGYELWWIHYNNLFHYFALPFSRYRRLLEYLENFKEVFLFGCPAEGLFKCFFEAHNCRVVFIRSEKTRKSVFPFGIFVQMVLTSISVIALIITRPKMMIFVGDKLQKSKDYDFRMSFIYKELRRKKLHFVEFIRSLESWKKIIKNFFIRKRPVIYSEGIIFLGRFLGFITFGRLKAKKIFGSQNFEKEENSDIKFKLLISHQYLLHVYDDIWAIRITKFLLWLIGVRTVFIAAVNERNSHAFLASKLNKIPVFGVLHGFASQNYNVYDFLPGFTGEKVFSVDKYGVWSDWWREYYLQNGNAYKPGQVIVSGPMRPSDKNVKEKPDQSKPVKVLFVSEQLAVPEEVLPFLEALLKEKDIDLYFTFRTYRDGFENWLKENRPDLLKNFDANKIIRTGIDDALEKCDVAVGTHSTAVLESLFSLKTPIFFSTRKWGDYFELDGNNVYGLFTKNPKELIDSIKQSHRIPKEELEKLKEKFFGDPGKNGSKWVVEEMEKSLKRAE